MQEIPREHRPCIINGMCALTFIISMSAHLSDALFVSAKKNMTLNCFDPKVQEYVQSQFNVLFLLKQSVIIFMKLMSQHTYLKHVFANPR